MRSTTCTVPGTAEYLPFGTDGLVLPFPLALPSVAEVAVYISCLLAACCSGVSPRGTTWWEPGKLSAGWVCRAVLSQPLIAWV